MKTIVGALSLLAGIGFGYLLTAGDCLAMTTGELDAAVAADVPGLTLAQSVAIRKAMANTIKDKTAAGTRIIVTDLGTLDAGAAYQRNGRNPGTGAAITYTAYKRVPIGKRPKANLYSLAPEIAADANVVAAYGGTAPDATAVQDVLKRRVFYYIDNLKQGGVVDENALFVASVGHRVGRCSTLPNGTRVLLAATNTCKLANSPTGWPAGLFSADAKCKLAVNGGVKPGIVPGGSCQ